MESEEAMWNSGEVFVQRQGHIEALEVGIHVCIWRTGTATTGTDANGVKDWKWEADHVKLRGGTVPRQWQLETPEVDIQVYICEHSPMTWR